MQKPQPLPSDHSEIDESFSDVFETHLTDWSYAITFGLRSVRPDEPHKYTSQVRMPLAQAKPLAVLMLRNIRQYEQAAGIRHRSAPRRAGQAPHTPGGLATLPRAPIRAFATRRTVGSIVSTLEVLHQRIYPITYNNELNSHVRRNATVDSAGLTVSDPSPVHCIRPTFIGILIIYQCRH